MTAIDTFITADSAAQFLLSQTKLRPKIGLVLGSGLGAFADTLADATRVPYSEIPTFPRSTAVGHAGQMVIGKAGTVAVAAMQGRVHLYEGYSAREVTFPIRVFARMGIAAVVLTNAAGGINLQYQQGALVALRDHLNLQGHNPLVGSNDERFGPRFPDMSEAYSKAYRGAAQQEAKRLGITLARRDLRGAARSELRNTRRNPLPAHDWRRPGGNVYGPGGARGAPHGHQGSRHLVRDQYGGGHRGPAHQS